MIHPNWTAENHSKYIHILVVKIFNQFHSCQRDTSLREFGSLRRSNSSRFNTTLFVTDYTFALCINLTVKVTYNYSETIGCSACSCLWETGYEFGHCFITHFFSAKVYCCHQANCNNRGICTRHVDQTFSMYCVIEWCVKQESRPAAYMDCTWPWFYLTHLSL